MDRQGMPPCHIWILSFISQWEQIDTLKQKNDNLCLERSLQLQCIAQLGDKGKRQVRSKERKRNQMAGDQLWGFHIVL